MASLCVAGFFFLFFVLGVVLVYSVRYWGISTGVVTRQAADRTVRLQGMASVDLTGEKATMKESKAKLARVRASGKNALHVSALILSEAELQRRLRMVQRTSQSFREWHSEHSKLLRIVWVPKQTSPRVARARLFV